MSLNIKILAFLMLPLAPLVAQQNAEPYEFKTVYTLEATPVKDQGKTNACWAYSTTSMLESELIRLSKGKRDLSALYLMRCMYREKCYNYVRRQGGSSLNGGAGLAHDVLNAVRRYGVVPTAAYPGTRGDAVPDHSQLEKTLDGMCSNFAQRAKIGKLGSAWMQDIDRVFDDFFGPVPQKFSAEGKEFTPQSYRDYLGILPEEYISLTSFTHHPFYEPFNLEIPDNWAGGVYYNLPLNDLLRCLNYSIQQGYSVVWDGDVSNPGLDRVKGLGIVPEKALKDKTEAEIKQNFVSWEPEQKITPELRQTAFDRVETTDDHLMHITGILDETHSGLYYVLKNSWGADSGREGMLYLSDAYMRLNTVSLLVNKNALPEDVQKRLGFKSGEVMVPYKKGTQSEPAKVNMQNIKPSELQNKKAIKDKAKEKQ